MGRSILAVVVGYLAIFALVFVSFSVAYLLLGPEGAFLPRSYEVSTTWIVVSFVLGFGAALAGGWICAHLARSDGAPKALAVVVLALGLLMAFPTLTGPPEAMLPREAGVGVMEAMNNGRTPGWIAILNPLVGAVGVLVGAGLRRRDGAREASVG